MSIYERLLFLETEIQLYAANFSEGRVSDITKKVDSYGERSIQHFNAIAFITEKGEQIPITGIIKNPPKITPEEMQYIKNGKTVVSSKNNSNLEARMFMIMGAIPKRTKPGIVLGDINPTYLWGTKSLPTMTELCVLDQSKKVLVTSLDRSTGLTQTMVSQGNGLFTPEFKLSYKNEEYLASSWNLFLKPRFFIPEWTIILIQMKSDLLAPLHNFTAIFPLMVLLSLWVVLMLSMVYIRRSLIPLKKLKEGTLRLAKSDFNNPVTITSGDEFEELADSFNTMAGQLNRQFKALSTVAEIGNAATTILDISNLT